MIKRILLLESGSFLNVGGAIIDTYNMYLGFTKNTSYKVDIYADLSKIDPKIPTITKEQMFDNTYDFIFLNSIRDVPIALSYARRNNGKTKYIYVDRGNVLINYKKASIKKLLPKMLVRRAYTHMMRTLLDYYVAITAEQFEHAQDFFNGSKTSVRYIPIAPHNEFKRHTQRGDYRYAIAVGRLDERQKKLNFLIHGIKRVVNEHPHLRKQEILRIVGTGPDEANYKRLTAKLGLQHNIKFLGFLREKDLVDSYNDAGFLVSTSEWESPGRTFLEAMACGLPLLINTGNNAIMSHAPTEHLVKEGLNGLVYRYGDLRDFSHKFYTLCSDEEMRKELAKEAYGYVQRYKFDNTLKAYLAILSKA